MMRKMMLLLILAAWVVFQAAPLGAVTLYDDFSTNYIKKSLWLDHYNGSTYIHERVREIDPVDGTLVIKLGSNEQNRPSRMGLSLTSAAPNPLTGLRADVKIVEMNNDPTDSATVFGRIAGLFYNIYTNNPAAGCLYGDVWAELVIGNRGNGLEAWLEIEVFDSCTNDTAIELDSASLTSGITLSMDHFYTLEITYNGGTQLTFSISDGGTPVGITHTFNGTDARLAPPHSLYGTLQAGVHDADGEYVDGYVHTEFDEVYVNGLAYDTFTAPPINRALWNGRDYVKESINGSARLKARGQDNSTRSRLYLRDRYTPYLEATARILDDSEVSPGARGRVRIGGHFYNQLYGPGSYNDYEGDVYMQVALELTNSGIPVARAIMAAANADRSDYTILYEQDFPMTILFNTDYMLSINFTATAVEFRCGSETLSRTISTAVHVPFNANRMVDSRLTLDAVGENGFISGQFDNVRVADPDYTNLDGNWEIEFSNSRLIVDPGGCVPDPDETHPIEVFQRNTEVIIEDDVGDLAAYGVISGSRVLLYNSELDGAGFYENWADVALSDADHMFGILRGKSTPRGCEEEGDLRITRVGANRFPTADDQAVSVIENSADNAITLTGSDPDSDPLTFAVGSGPTNGALSGMAPNLLYTPNAGYVGLDTFTFTVDDGNGGTDTGTVSITVTMAANQAPTADDQSVTLDEDAADHVITLTGSDPDSDPLTFTIGSAPTHGALTGTAPDLRYTPDADYNGPDSFTFTVDDGNGGSDTGTVDITVTPIQDAPVANDDSITVDRNSTDNAITCTGTDADGDTLTFAVATGPANGTLSGTAPDMLYSPNADYSGADSFTFTVDDGNGGTDTGTVNITVNQPGGGGGGGGCFIQSLFY